MEVIATLHTEGDRQAIQLNMRDTSERKKFERELQETQKLESLGLLAGGIAHDFNNLLTGVLGNASLALSETSPGQPLRVRVAGDRGSGRTCRIPDAPDAGLRRPGTLPDRGS